MNWKWCGRKPEWTNLINLSWNLSGRVECVKTTKENDEVSRRSDGYLNPALPEHKPETVTAWTRLLAGARIVLLYASKQMGLWQVTAITTYTEIRLKMLSRKLDLNFCSLIFRCFTFYVSCVYFKILICYTNVFLIQFYKRASSFT